MRETLQPLAVGKVKFILGVSVIACLAYAVVYFFVFGSSQATVIYLRGKAFLDPEKPLKVGDKLKAQAPIRLEERSRVFLQLASGVVLKLSNKARLQIGESSSQLTLSSGDLYYNGKESSLSGVPPTVALADSLLEIHSKEFDVRIQGKKTLLSVYEGHVTVKGKGGEVVVKQNTGTVITGGSAQPPVPLPGVTRIMLPKDGSKLAEVIVKISCAAVEGATQYFWECSANPSFTAVLAEQTVPEAGGLLRGVDEDGEFYLRVRAMNAEGLVGQPSKVMMFKMTAFEKLRRNAQLTRNFYINKEYAKAIESARKGLKIWPEHAETLEKLCLSQLAEKQLDAAVATAKRIKSSPNRKTRALFPKVLAALKKAAPGNAAVKALDE